MICSARCRDALHDECRCSCGGRHHGAGKNQTKLELDMDMKANYVIIEETDDLLLIKDVGPWHQYMTITNAAETVVKELAGRLGGRRLEYLDSEGERTLLKVTNGKFSGFAPEGNKT